MCGIVGGIALNEVWHVFQDALPAMTFALRKRGPDDEGQWLDAEVGIGLAHRRLSILDLSPAGHQPMTSSLGRFVIAYNGEIYNHLEIRKELEKFSSYEPHWRGHSDTETLLAGFEAWGIEATLQRSIGMFALAVWDKTERALTLTRDRLGEKPLYYGWNRGAFLFASELKSLRAFSGFDADINRDALTLLLRHSYIPTPYSIYRGIFKLWPGSMLTLRIGAATSCPWELDSPPFDAFRDNGNGVSLSWYWSSKVVAEKCQSNPFTGTENEAVVALERLLTEAVQAQQISDVPLGAFLSGGVDSSTIVALMQAGASRPVKTFAIGFHEAGYNEAVYAKEVARHLGTDHTELYVTSAEAQAVIPGLSAMFDEPFSDSSQIPTFLVAQMARQHVTVSLSGDAGDELFGGYGRYFLSQSIWDKVRYLPYAGRKTLATAIRLLSNVEWNVIGKRAENFLPDKFLSRPLGDRAYRLAEILSARNPDEMYRGFVSHWKSPAEVVINSREPETSLTDQRKWAHFPEFEQRMMYLDVISYLPDDILVKVDRAAMAVNLETRMPFLDNGVVEFAWRLPIEMKFRKGQGKWILRQILYKYVPKELIERPKMGFGVPIDSWLRGPLREWAESLLAEDRLKREGFFHAAPIRLKWAEHLSGARDWHYYLWDVLMFQAWLEEWHS